MYNNFNPYFQQQNAFNPYGNASQNVCMNRYEIIHVNGENGARAFQMAPNSNVILLDDTSARIFLVQTDGAGYKTVTPYSICPYEPEPNVDVKSLESRIRKLEEYINESNTKQIKSESKPKSNTND